MHNLNRSALAGNAHYLGILRRKRFACIAPPAAHPPHESVVVSVAFHNLDHWEHTVFIAYFMLMMSVWGFANLAYVISGRLRFIISLVGVVPQGLVLFIATVISYPSPPLFLPIYFLCVLPCLFSLMYIPYTFEKAHRSSFLQDERLKELLIRKQGAIHTQQGIIERHEDQIRRANQIVKELASEDKRFDEVMAHRDISFDDVDIRDPIGEGSFGIVYRGKYFGEMVAVKTLRIGQALDKAAIRRFRQEMRLMAPLKHPHLCEMYGASWKEGADKMCIVLQYAGRGSLSSNWTGVPFKGKLLPLLEQAASCLVYLHSLNPAIVHRDIKPDNILVTANWTALLADLGSSRILDAAGDAEMTITGTPYYMAPEVLAGEKYDTACDVYSFGVVMLETVKTGHKLSNSERGIKGGAQYFERPSIDDATRSNHPEVVDLALSCCAAEPSERPRFEAIREQLATCLEPSKKIQKATSFYM